MMALTNSRSMVLLPALALLALGAFMLVLLLSSGNAAATCVKPPSGDWNIVNGDNCVPPNGAFLPLSGDVHIQNGGSLTLNGATMRVDSTYDGEFMIEVQTGGTLKALSGTNITAGDPRYEYRFLVRSGSWLEIRDSTVKEAGFGTASDDDLGLKIETENAIISGSIFRDNYVALYLKGVSPTIDNSSFEYNYLAVLCQGPSTLGFYDNKVQSNSKGAYFYYASPDIVKNLFYGNAEDAIYLLWSDANIYGNRILSNMYGIAAIHSSPYIGHNNISSNWDGVRAFFGAPIIVDNEMWMDNRSAIYMTWTGGRIERNSISAVFSGIPLSVYGIFLQNATTSVLNNTILNITLYGMWIDGDSNLKIADNLVMGAGTAINIVQSKIEFVNNRIIEDHFGLTVSTVIGTVKGSTFSSNYVAFEIYKANSSLLIESNIFSKNTRKGLSLQEASVIVTGNTFDSNPKSISCNRSVPTIIGNTIKNSEYGVEIAGYSVLYFANNTVMNGNYTVYSLKSRSTLYNNTILSSWNYSIYLDLGSYSRIVNNHISGKSAKGVFILRSNADIIGNDFMDASVGIYAEKANLTLDGNTIHDNDLGLMLNWSNVSILSGDIHDQTQFAIVASEVNIYATDLDMTRTQDGIFLTGSGKWRSRARLHNISITDGRKGVSLFSGSLLILTDSKVAHNKETGIYSVDAILDITDSIISDNKYGISTIGSKVTAKGTYFSFGEEALSMDGTTPPGASTLSLDGCTFINVNYTGVKANGVNISVKNTLFTQNGNGMLVENGTLTIIKGHILENTDMGVRVNGTRVIVRDSLFIGNMDGIFDVGGSIIDIYDTNMSSNEVFGLYTDDSTLSSNITISRRIIIQDNGLLVRGEVRVVEDGHLLLLRAPLILYSVNAGEAKVFVRTGGSLEIIESLIYAQFADAGYIFVAEPNSGLTIVNSTIRHCGRGLAAPNDGFLIKTQYSNIRDTLFENNSVGLYIYGTNFNATGLRFEDNRISLRAEMSSVYLINSSFMSSKEKDIVLVLSTVNVLNTKVAFTKVDVTDQGSIFVVLWYLHISVSWNDGQPIDSASIVITDKALSKVTTLTDHQGFARWLIVREYQQVGPASTGYFAFSPLTINATDRGISVSKSEYVSATKTITIVLVDKTPPNVIITAPVNGSVAYDSSVLVIGTAIDDGSGEVEVDVSVDGIAWIPANGGSAWSASLSIPEGNHTILARARDARGNIGITSIVLEVDLSSPMLEIFSPSDGDLTNLTSVNVRGRIHIGSGLIINGDTVPISVSGTFDKSVLLDEGPNVIHIKAIRGLESMETDLTVFRDTRRPTISLKHPAPGKMVNSTFVTVTVSSDEEATFYIGGQFAQSFGGESDISLELPEGTNKVHVKATDKAGNVNETDVTIIVDRTRPVLTLLKPKSPVFKTIKDRMQILGITEPGSELTIDGKIVPVGTSGNFTLDRKLKLGSNEVRIVATDKAGNTNEIVLSVKRTEFVDMGRYYALLGIAIMAALIADVGAFVYFRNFYRKKGQGPDQGSAETETPSETTDEQTTKPTRTGPRRPPARPFSEGTLPAEPQDTEFKEVEDLGEF